MNSHEALLIVTQKVAELQMAINALSSIVETKSFGCAEWCESLDEALFELEEDITEYEQE